MRLNVLLKYATENIPFYMNKLSDSVPELKDFPIVKKEDYLSDSRLFINHAKNYKDLREFQTSGSTGKPMVIYKSQGDYIAQLRAIWRIRNQYGIKPSDKCMEFVFSNRKSCSKGLIVDYQRKKMSIDINSLDSHYTDIMKAVCEFAPKYIIGYPSVISYFAKLLKLKGARLPKSVSFIESMGEYLLPSQKEFIMEVMGIPIKNYYGCTEIFGIAYSGRDENLYPINDNVYVEVIPHGTNKSCYDVEGDIVVTGLNSIDMTFIRYNLEDTGIMRRGNGHSDYIEITMGRRYQQIFIAPDKLMHSGYLYGIVDTLNKQFRHCIIWFRFQQENLQKLCFLIKLKPGYEFLFPAIEKKALFMLYDFFPQSTTITVSPSEERQLKPSGNKFKYFESNIQEGDQL